MLRLSLGQRHSLDRLRAVLNGQGLLELLCPSVADMNLENTEGGRFASGASDLAAVALPAEAPRLGSGTSPRVDLWLAMPWNGRSVLERSST